MLPLVVPSDRSSALTAQSPSWPSLSLTASQLCTFELLASGALSPLGGYMVRREYDSVRTERQLLSGQRWTLPVTLDVPDRIAHTLASHTHLALRDGEGVMLAALQIEDLWAADGGWKVGGRVEVLQMPRHHDFHALRLTPAAVRQERERRGWSRVVAVFCDGPEPYRSHRQVRDLLNDGRTGVLLLAVVRPTNPGDSQRYRRLQTHSLVANLYPPGTALPGVLPFAEEIDGTDAITCRAIVARNYGCSHMLVEDNRDSALIADAVQKETGVALVPHNPMDVEVADFATAARERRTQKGFTVFFTGLSGSGKSTICNLVMTKILETGRAVTLLDGDLVRKHLSSELGFSKEHREINIRRIGFVASEITKHGGIAMCAPIAPYAETRREIRSMVQGLGGFLLVYIATPLEVCEARDRKGLYAKARAGLIDHFTGISDPYEAPDDADVTIDTSGMDPNDAAQRVLEKLFSLSLLDRREFPAAERNDPPATAVGDEACERIG